MANLPFMPFWTDAYLADTVHLTTEQHGAYLLLLFQAWRSHDCSLADDDELLALQAKVSPAKWRAMKPIVMSFWKLDKRRKRWVQKRLRIEREKVMERKAKAKDSAASRWKDKKKGDANALPTQCEGNASIPILRPKEKSNDFSKRAGAQKKSSRDLLMEAFQDV
ncbi:UNVERIFIED_ORG: uncharacterized protein YdaU (DUF1376 family) [Agrobacterium larrymoorei]|nr:uncharacterized protein YdaU (DUF1376 family) [Agrobacterium larrymoorei]